MPKEWDGDRRVRGLRVRWYLPRKGLRGVVIVDGPEGSGLEAWFGDIPEFPEAWIAMRDPKISECMVQDGKKAGWIEYLTVHWKMRGKGLGSLILEVALEQLYRLEVDHVWLLVAPISDKWREALYNFYDQHGFERMEACGGSSDNVMRIRLDRIE